MVKKRKAPRLKIKKRRVRKRLPPKVLSVRMDRSGCFEIRKEIVERGTDLELEWEMAYSIQDGGYIGDLKTARNLAKHGIVPERAQPTNNVCSVGYSPKEKSWFGWSHRAIVGFKLGDMIFNERFKGATDKTLFKKHGSKKIEHMTDARSAAVAFAASVS